MASEKLTLWFPAPPEDRNKWLRPALMSSNSERWNTPVHIRDAVVEALGGIVDLDPCAEPERAFPATRHFTEEDNGLTKRWLGRVYMNPPYGRKTRVWTTKLLDELRDGWTTEAVALLAVRSDTRFWQQLEPDATCFIRGRLRFSGYDQSAPFPSAALYFGPNVPRFEDAFRQLGKLQRAAA